jgi:hypothetical protein
MTNRRALGLVRIAAAVLILAAVGTQLHKQIDRSGSIVNFVSFFTIESNLLASVVFLLCGLAALRGDSIGRYAMVRGAAATYMVTTGITYTLLLRGLEDSLNTTLPWVNTVLHYLMPAVVLADWLLLPPERGIDARRAMWWLVFPLAYAVYSLVRGPSADFYPYPFINVDLHGYPRVLVTCVIVGIAVAVIASGLAWYSRWRADRSGGRHGASRLVAPGGPTLSRATGRRSFKRGRGWPAPAAGRPGWRRPCR